MEERIANIIYNWVKEQFGESEANEPSWNIEALAKEIDKHRWEIYRFTQEEYEMEDVEDVAKLLNIKLSKEEKRLALHKYENVEDSKLEALEWIIKDIKESK